MSDLPKKPPRPTIPVSLYVLLAIIVVEGLVMRADPGPVVVACLVACAGAACLVTVVVLARRGCGDVAPALGAVWVAIAAAALLAVIACARGAALEESLAGVPVSSFSFEVDGEMSEGSDGWRGRAVVRRGNATEGSVWLLAANPLEPGTMLTCVGRYVPNADDDWGVSSRMQGLWGTVRVMHVMSSGPRGGLLGALDGWRGLVLQSFDPSSSEARAVLAGCICGSRAAIRADGLDDVFAACGLSHLVAVSGGHLVIVCVVVGLLLERMRLRPVVRGTMLLLASGLFVLFCGAPASAVRAWAMLAAMSGATLLGRRAHALSSVCSVACIMALWEPTLSGQLGFLLSVSSVVGICLFAGYGRYAIDRLPRVRRLPRWVPRRMSRAFFQGSDYLRDVVAVTLVAQLVTLPLTVPAFSRVSLVAPLANVVASPLFLLVIGIGVVAACLVPVSVAEGAALLCADVVAGPLVWLMRLIARIPAASVALEVDAVPALALALVFGAVLLVVWPDVHGRLVAALASGTMTIALGLLAYGRFFSPARVCVLDVGQGDAVLVIDGSAAVLVDTGPDEAILAALSRQGVYHLDAVILTHLHDDHVGGLSCLLGSVACGRVLVADGVSCNESPELAKTIDDLTGDRSEELRHGDMVRVGSFSLRVVSPTEEVGGGENGDSIELAFSYDEGGATLTGLLAGDAEQDETGAVIARGDVGDVDLLKVGHHGSEVSISSEEAADLDPEVSVASAGEGNSFGHPSPTCVETLEGVGSTFLCTKDVGDVTVTPGANGPSVQVASRAVLSHD